MVHIDHLVIIDRPLMIHLLTNHPQMTILTVTILTVTIRTVGNLHVMIQMIPTDLMNLYPTIQLIVLIAMILNTKDQMTQNTNGKVTKSLMSKDEKIQTNWIFAMHLYLMLLKIQYFSTNSIISLSMVFRNG